MFSALKDNGPSQHNGKGVVSASVEALVIDTVLGLLLDPQPNVQQKALTLVPGITRCHSLYPSVVYGI